MKKALCTLLCLAVCAALAACGAQPQSGAARLARRFVQRSGRHGFFLCPGKRGAKRRQPARGLLRGGQRAVQFQRAGPRAKRDGHAGRRQRQRGPGAACARKLAAGWLHHLDEGGRKVLELGSVWKLPVYSDTAAPFTKEMTDPFLNNEMGYPEGYGLQRTLDFMLDGRHAKMILYKTWPDDSDKPWYPHYLFYVVPDGAGDGYYVVRLDFFSFEESAGDDTLFAIAQGMTATAA